MTDKIVLDLTTFAEKQSPLHRAIGAYCDANNYLLIIVALKFTVVYNAVALHSLIPSSLKNGFICTTCTGSSMMFILMSTVVIKINCFVRQNMSKSFIELLFFFFIQCRTMQYLDARKATVSEEDTNPKGKCRGDIARVGSTVYTHLMDILLLWKSCCYRYM